MLTLRAADEIPLFFSRPVESSSPVSLPPIASIVVLRPRRARAKRVRCASVRRLVSDGQQKTGTAARPILELGEDRRSSW